MAKAADRLKELIEQAKAQGLTKSKIARKMGITPQQLSNLLHGKNQWRLGQVERVCEILGITLAEAFLKEGEDVEIFVLLRGILDASPESYHAIVFNIEAFAEKIANSGPRLRTKPMAKVAGIKTQPRTIKRGRFYLPPGIDIGPKIGSAVACFSTIIGSLL